METDGVERDGMEPQWLARARRLAALAQTGLAYARDPFDVERYHAIRALAAEMMADGADAEPSRVLDLLSRDAGYATPKVDVRGVIFQEQTILLVRERSDGLWTLPGGWADVGDSPAEAVVREIYEESGYRARATRLLAVLDRTRQKHPPLPFHVYKIFLRCEIVGGGPNADTLETSGVGFFREDQLPELSRGRVLPAQIARLFEHYRHPEWPADFD